MSSASDACTGRPIMPGRSSARQAATRFGRSRRNERLNSGMSIRSTPEPRIACSVLRHRMRSFVRRKDRSENDGSAGFRTSRREASRATGRVAEPARFAVVEHRRALRRREQRPRRPARAHHARRSKAPSVPLRGRDRIRVEPDAGVFVARAQVRAGPADDVAVVRHGWIRGDLVPPNDADNSNTNRAIPTTAADPVSGSIPLRATSWRLARARSRGAHRRGCEDPRGTRMSRFGSCRDTSAPDGLEPPIADTGTGHH